ncbi:MAG: hypothetical protein J0H06_13955 [Actinobacteria bacterium]|nr:hypothetical protein [Actinomycetota bacterium]
MPATGAADPAARPARSAPAAHAKTDPQKKATVSDAQPVESTPVADKTPARSPVAAVGHLLSRPFEDPTSPEALPGYFLLLFTLLVIGGLSLHFWFEVEGVAGWNYWYHRSLANLSELTRRGRNAD